MHLVRPDIGALHRLGRAAMAASTSPLSISVRGVDGWARSAVSTSARSVSLASASSSPRAALPRESHSPRARRPRRRNRRSDDGHEAGNVATEDSSTAIRLVPTNGPASTPAVGRAHHAAVQHAGQADVVHEGQLAGGLGRKIDARHRLADDGVVADGLDGDVVGKLEANRLAADQFAIADAAIVARGRGRLRSSALRPAAPAARPRARSESARACAAALRSGTAVIWMVSLAIVAPWFGTMAVSPSTTTTRAKETSSSSATIWPSAVRMPVPRSTWPL